MAVKVEETLLEDWLLYCLLKMKSSNYRGICGKKALDKKGMPWKIFISPEPKSNNCRQGNGKQSRDKTCI